MTGIPAGAAEAAAAEVKAYLRIARDDTDVALAGFASAALALAEAFTGQVLIARAHQAVLPVTRGWRRLAPTPVRAITTVEGLPADGAPFALAIGDHAIDIDAAGDGWVRVTEPGAAARIRVSLAAGLASEWAALPEPLRQGVVRMAAHLHGERDGAEAPPPASVTALWRPFRRMRLFDREHGREHGAWDPPSALLSPAHGGAMAYLRAVAAAFAGLAVAAGVPVRFQVGEPWWWVTPGRRLCLYDAAARAALPAHAPINDVRAGMSPNQRAALDAAGALLAASTAALVAAVRAVAPGAEALLLVYLPTVLDEAAPELRRANVPAGWAAPAFDVLQCEDYDWVVAGRHDATRRGIAAMAARLGYPEAGQHYFSGFVLRPEARDQWREIAEAVRRSGAAETVVWALPQVARDGFTWFDNGEGEVQPFDDVRFPIAIGREAEVSPGFSTTIVTSAGGTERRNAEWAEARTRYDVGPGVRSEADIAALLAFFRARMGPARAFRLQDPFDWRSGPEAISPLDQRLGVGDGERTAFALAKAYGTTSRRITRPVAGTVRVSVGGAETAGFTLGEGGTIALDAAPGAGVEVRAGFAFDVPVRFAEDALRVTRATFLAGEAASVPLIEVREA